MGASRALTLLLLIVHAGALAIAVLMPIPLWIRLALVVVIVASLAHTIGMHGLRAGDGAINEIELVDAVCVVHTRRGSARYCRIDAQFVHPWVVVLRVKAEAGWWPWINIVVARDAVEQEPFRVLRVRLNLARLSA